MQEKRVLRSIFVLCLLSLFCTHIFGMQRYDFFRNGYDKINYLKWNDTGKFIVTVDTHKVAIRKLPKTSNYRQCEWRRWAPTKTFVMPEVLQAMDRLQHRQDFNNNFFWDFSGRFFNMHFANKYNSVNNRYTEFLSYDVYQKSGKLFLLEPLAEVVYQTPFFSCDGSKIFLARMNSTYSGVITKYSYNINALDDEIMLDENTILNHKDIILQEYRWNGRSYFNNDSHHAFLMSPSKSGKKVIVLYVNGDICIHDVFEENCCKIISGMAESSYRKKVINNKTWKNKIYPLIKTHQIVWSANGIFAAIITNHDGKAYVRVINVRDKIKDDEVAFEAFTILHAEIDNNETCLYLLVKDGNQEKRLIRYGIFTKDFIVLKENVQDITCFALHPNGKLLATGREDGMVEFYVL